MRKFKKGLDKTSLKGEILRDTGHLIREKGYKLKILDLINMEKSDCYNPFIYLDSDNDARRLVSNFLSQQH